MRNSIIILLLLLALLSCNKMDNEEQFVTVKYLDPGPCCSNMELINQEEIYSELVGYSETILAATNIIEFWALDLQNGDLLSIQFDFTTERNPCNIDCNRHHGIPIELIAVKIQ